MNLTAYLEQIAGELQQELACLLPDTNTDSPLTAAMRYSVFNGGKRLRPALFCSTVTALGSDYHPLLPYAAAIEMIHCYSLIHDDLPAMDNDDLRRGQPTCHIVYGEDMAILAGDALLTLAAEILSRPLADIPADRQLAAAKEIMSGAGDMVKGQALEIAAANKNINIDLLTKIYRGKTAALFQAAALGAACLTGATAKQKEELTNYCLELGLAFQITDDILDIKGDEKVVGKRVGSDLKNDKLTFASIMGCDAAAIEAANSAKRAVASLASWGKEADILRAYPDFFVHRDH